MYLILTSTRLRLVVVNSENNAAPAAPPGLGGVFPAAPFPGAVVVVAC